MDQKSPTEKTNSSPDNKCVVSPAKKSDIATRGSPKEASKSTEENPICNVSSEVANLSQKKVTLATTAPTTEIQDEPLRRDDVCDIENVSLEDEAANALQLEYEQKYASVYSKEILFAVDLLNLVRSLHELPHKWNLYNTCGEKPISPCDAFLDYALCIFWDMIKDRIGKLCEVQLKNKGVTYNHFQKIVLLFAEKMEHREYSEKAFLLYCLALAEWAVHADLNGIPKALEFIPLVICRVIQNLKDSGKVPPNFWERIEETALKVRDDVKKSNM